MTKRQREKPLLSDIGDRLKNAPEWAKNAVAIGAVVLTILGVRLDVSALRAEQDRLDNRQGRISRNVETNEDRIDTLSEDVEKTEDQASRLRTFVRDIEKDLDKILEAIRNRDESP